MNLAPQHFSTLARRTTDSPISWLMKVALEHPGIISLAAGFTDNETLPVEAVAACTRDLFRQPKAAQAALQYGTTIGLPDLRRQLLKRWQTQDRIASRQSQVTSDDIVVTNGSQQLLYLASEVLCDPGDIVLVEDPTYFVYLGIVETLGIRARGFSSLADLKAKLQQLKSRRLLPRLKMLYLVTYFRNPTGQTWSFAEKREALAIVKHYERAAGHTIYIVEDAAYRDLRFEGADEPSFKSLDLDNKRVMYANTLTKPFATGIKLGYGILPPLLLRAVLRNKSNHDFGSSNFLQTILARAIAGGLYDQHLPKIAAAYRRKRDAMVDALNRYGVRQPSGAVRGAARRQSARGLAHSKAPALRFSIPHGGLYIWPELPPHIKTGLKSRLFKRAIEAGVLYIPGEMCYCADPTRPIPQNFIRLSFGAPTLPSIQHGVRTLARALR